MKLQQINNVATIIQIVILFFLVQPVYSQWYLMLSYDQEYNDNPFRLPAGESNLISDIQFQTGRAFNRYNISYSGNYTCFNNISDRNYYWHQLALFNSTDTTSWGLYTEQRMNKSDYNIFDYKEFSTFIKHRFFLKQVISEVSASFQYDKFDQLPEFNNWKLRANLNLRFKLLSDFC